MCVILCSFASVLRSLGRNIAPVNIRNGTFLTILYTIRATENVAGTEYLSFWERLVCPRRPAAPHREIHNNERHHIYIVVPFVSFIAPLDIHPS